MTPDAKLRMDVYQEGQRAFSSGAICPYIDWRAKTWAKGHAAAKEWYSFNGQSESLEAMAQQEQSEPDLDAICQDLQEKTYTQAMRIADLEKDLTVAYIRGNEDGKKAAKQEQGEPVAWLHEVTFGNGFKGRVLNSSSDHPYADDERVEYSQAKVVSRPLVFGDTTPQQRTWVGLTEAELENVWPFVFKPHELGNKAIYQAIEAKLREKNSH